MPLPNGKKYYQRFRLKDYVSQSAAYKAAIKARDEEAMLIRRAEEGLYSFSEYTVQQLFDMISENFDRRLATYISYEKMYNKYIRDLYGSYNIKDIREADILKTLQNCASQCGANYVSKLKSVWKKIYIVGQRKRVVQTDLSHLVENPRSEIVTERSLNEQNITEEEFKLFCQAMPEYGHYLPSEKEKIYNRKKYCVQIHFNTTDTIASNRGYLFYNLDMGLLSFLFPTAEDIGKRGEKYTAKKLNRVDGY